jgi:hypothetical protein
MSDELTERNISKLILIVRFAYATLNVGHPIYRKSICSYPPVFSDYLEEMSFVCIYLK